MSGGEKGTNGIFQKKIFNVNVVVNVDRNVCIQPPEI